MILPSEIATKPTVIDIPKTEYSFPDQQRKDDKGIYHMGYYTASTIQTYDYQGRPNDAQGDNWD